MEILHETKDLTKKNFFSHVFDFREESQAELLNATQYIILAALPVTILNKLIQRFIPEFSPDSSSVELLLEVAIQLIVMVVGIILIHRIITYIPTYSGFKYENLAITNVIIAFLIIILSIQTKIGMKISELWERLVYLWDGSETESNKDKVKKNVRVNSAHVPSRADFIDNTAVQQNTFPPAPVATSRQPANEMYDNMMGGSGGYSQNSYGLLSGGVMAANSVLGGSFGSMF